MRIVALGPGDVDSIPASALEVARTAQTLIGGPLPDEVAAALGRSVMPVPADMPADVVVVALDLEANRLAARFPDAETHPSRSVLRGRAIGAAAARLAQVGAHLRIHCPWDREQTAATIVPHTVEEAFEVADAVADGDPSRQADEIGDLLFQSVFLAQLLEETGDGDLAEIADAHADKLISRHPHVYGDAIARSAGGVRDLWEANKRAERGGAIFHEMPPGLPALAYAAKAQKRAASVGFDFQTTQQTLEKLAEEVAELRAEPNAHEVGDVMFACIAVARSLRIDPELAVRGAAQRFRDRVERAEQLAADAGQDFTTLDLWSQDAWYDRAKDDLNAQ